MSARLYDNLDAQVRELHINGDVFAQAKWEWIVRVVAKRDKTDWLYLRWHPHLRFGHYPEPPDDVVRDEGGDEQPST